eukprot:PhM_4_TR13204/c0_g1_i1/m.3838/K14376/PAP; poly(A) polymerase
MSIQVLSEDKPTSEELELNTKYIASIAHTYESKEEARRRETVLLQIDRLVKGWVRHEALKKGWREDAAKAAGGRIFTSGSYRMGVHGPGSDIDVAIIVPSFITQDDFFGSFYGILEKHKDVKELGKAPWAHVPLISLYFLGIELDLLFAPLNRTSIPNNVNIFDMDVVRGLDDTVARAVSGPAVAERMLKVVPNVRVFRECLRGIKLWASSRGLYGNKYAYPNGVALAVLVARVCQLYPNQCASTILLKFFTMYSTWFSPDVEVRRNNPIFLTPTLSVDDPDMQRISWDASIKPKQAQEIFPVITPALPYQNACFNVVKSTLRVICDEFARGATLLKHNPSDFSEVWAPTEFFVRYNHYMVVVVRAKGRDWYRRWSGTVEARIRMLLIALERNNPTLHCHLHPKTYEPPQPQDDATTTTTAEKQQQQADDANITYEGYVFVGLHSTVPKGTFDLSKASQEFMEDIRDRARRMALGVKMLDPQLKVMARKDIPTWAFDPTKAEALQAQLERVNAYQEADRAKKRGTTTTAMTTTVAAGESGAKRVAVEGEEGKPMPVVTTANEEGEEGTAAAAAPGGHEEQHVDAEDVLAMAFGA